MVFTLCIPFFLNDTIKGHDLIFHLDRIDGLKYGILSGQFPVRIDPYNDFFYGNPLPIMYPHLLLYIPALLSFYFKTIDCYSAYIILMIFLFANNMYFMTKGITKKDNLALYSTLIALSSAYFLCDLFTRCALGEITFLTFSPLAIYGLYNITFEDCDKWFYLVIGMFFIITSHILGVIIIVVSFVIFVIINFRRVFLDKNKLKYIFISILLTLLLSAYILIPLIEFYNLPFKMPFEIELSENTANIISVIFKIIVFYRTRINFLLEQKYALCFGAALGIGFILSIFFICKNIKKNDFTNKKINILLTFFLVGTSMLFLATDSVFYKIVKTIKPLYWILSKLQFPWRFLGISSIFLAVASSIAYFYFFNKIFKNKPEMILKILVFFICIFSIIFFIIDYVSLPKVKNVNDNLFVHDYEYEFEDQLFSKLQMSKNIFKPSMNIKVFDTKKDLLKANFKYEFVKSKNYVQEEIDNYDYFHNYFEIKNNPEFNLEDNYVNGEINREFENYIFEEQYNKYLDYIDNNRKYVDVPLFYYPGYEAYDENGRKLETSYNRNHLIRVYLENNKGEVRVYYKCKLLWKIMDFISLITLILFGIYLVNKNLKCYRKMG